MRKRTKQDREEDSTHRGAEKKEGREDKASRGRGQS